MFSPRNIHFEWLLKAKIDFFRTDGYFSIGQQNCPNCFLNTLYYSNLDQVLRKFSKVLRKLIFLTVWKIFLTLWKIFLTVRKIFLTLA